MRRLTVPVCAAGVALVAAACGSSGKQAHRHAQTGSERPATLSSTVAVQTRTATAPPSRARIRRAATLTAAEPGYRARITASIQLPQFNGNALSGVGPGYFDPRSNSGTLDSPVR